jgi:hypothetical protein
MWTSWVWVCHSERPGSLLGNPRLPIKGSSPNASAIFLSNFVPSASFTPSAFSIFASSGILTSTLHVLSTPLANKLAFLSKQ